MTCLLLGIPRQGPPARIFATDRDITMLYRGGVDGAGGYAEHRMIALDGKPHDPQRAAHTYMDTRSANGMATRSSSTPSASATRPGWPRRLVDSDQMRVIEKFTRPGTSCSTK